tara:strand:+ start:1960 stop:2469 length:510 start_codon:yes stop_codon:yes gene_type:complete
MSVSKFKGKNGNFLTVSLFKEMDFSKDKSSVLYTLKDEDNEFPSLRKLYLQEGDITEYKFAVKHLYNWDHWVHLRDLEWMRPLVLKWRKDLDVKLKSDTLHKIILLSFEEGSTGLAASRFILDKGIHLSPLYQELKEENKSEKGQSSSRTRNKNPDYAEVLKDADRLLN